MALTWKSSEAGVVRGLWLGLLLLVPGGALAEPVDLLDATPRWITVAFEVSPPDRPAQANSVYSRDIPAWLEPGDQPDHRKVTVDRRDVEQVLMAAHDPVPGSFSDFTWCFDASTGRVVAAELSGSLKKELDWGLFRSKAKARIEVHMSTEVVSGFEQPRRWLGQMLFGFCDDPVGPDCTVVPAVEYDARSGYVNAVGELTVHFGDLTLRTFSPLGEAVFSEIDPATERASLRSVQRTAGGAIRSVGWAAAPAVSAGPPGDD